MNNTLLNNIKKICCKKPNERNAEDIETLNQVIKTNKVFASISERYGKGFLKPCCKYLKYEYYDTNKYVFLYGSVGSKFYIILSGKVGVEIPFGKSKERFEEILQLSEGDCFGELALESDKPRAASIVCKTPCFFMYLHKNDYKECIGKYVKDRRLAIVEFLSTLPQFKGFTKGSLSKITFSMQEKKYQRGQFVYREGDLSSEIYILQQGELAFFKRLSVVLDKSKPYVARKHFQINVANIGKGEFFGEQEVLADEPRTTSCKCISDECFVYSMNKNVKTIQQIFKSIKNDEFWSKLKARTEKRKIEIENRVKMMVTIKDSENLSKNSLAPTRSVKSYKTLDPVRIERHSTNPSIDLAKEFQQSTPLQLPRSITLVHTPSSSQIIKSRLSLDPVRMENSGIKGFIEKNAQTRTFFSENLDTNELSGNIFHTASGKTSKDPDFSFFSNLNGFASKNLETQSTRNLATEKHHTKKFSIKTFQSPSASSRKFQKTRKGVSIYPMNSFPVYSALWSP